MSRLFCARALLPLFGRSGFGRGSSSFGSRSSGFSGGSSGFGSRGSGFSGGSSRSGGFGRGGAGFHGGFFRLSTSGQSYRQKGGDQERVFHGYFLNEIVRELDGLNCALYMKRAAHFSKRTGFVSRIQRNFFVGKPARYLDFRGLNRDGFMTRSMRRPLPSRPRRGWRGCNRRRRGPAAGLGRSHRPRRRVGAPRGRVPAA